MYLQGSFAVGDADEDSDVDFMAAIVEPLSQEEVTSLTAIHASLYEREGYWPKHLEGSYAPAAALRRYELNQPPWHYLEGSSTVVDSIPKLSVGGEVQLDYAPSGLVWRPTCPAANALDGGRPLSSPSRAEPVMSRVEARYVT